MKFNRIKMDEKIQLLEDSKNMTTKELSLKYNKAISSINQLLRNNGLKSKEIDRRKFTNDFNEELFSSFNEISCYIAGFIAADGCIIKDYGVKISIDIKDLYFLKSMAKYIGGYEVKEYNNICSLQFNSKIMVNDLKYNFNIVNKKSLILKYPYQIPIEYNSHFIRGYFA